jgi:hypothetical protein
VLNITYDIQKTESTNFYSHVYIHVNFCTVIAHQLRKLSKHIFHVKSPENCVQHFQQHSNIILTANTVQLEEQKIEQVASQFSEYFTS